MNEFTIEELVLLASWSVNRYEEVGNDQATDEGTISLSHKIQDMILNYCEHRWIEPNFAYIERCGKCERILNDKKSVLIREKQET